MNTLAELFPLIWIITFTTTLKIGWTNWWKSVAFEVVAVKYIKGIPRVTVHQSQDYKDSFRKNKNESQTPRSSLFFIYFSVLSVGRKVYVRYMVNWL